MTEWSLAIRNLLRNRRRSLSTLLALAIGLSAVLLFGGFKANLIYTMLTVYVRAGGHLQIQHRDYFLYGSGNPSAYGIADYSRLLAAIRTDAVLQPLIVVATPILRFGGLAGNFDAGISRTVIGTGYEAKDFRKMRHWNEFSIPYSLPEFPLASASENAAIVGIGVARVLQLCQPLKLADCTSPVQVQLSKHALTAPHQVAKLPSDIAELATFEGKSNAGSPAASGARLELLSGNARGAPNVAGLNVVAAEDQGFKELDDISVILHLTQAQSLVFGRDRPMITAIMVQLTNTADQLVAAKRLRELVAAHDASQLLVVRDVDQLNPYYVQSRELFDVIFGFIFVLIGAIVLFTVGNTMNTAVVERTVEIGTLRAIGLRQSGIRRLFIIEGFVLGFVGALSGLLVALMVGELINRSGLTWLPPGSSLRLLLQLRVLGDGAAVVGTVLGLILVATLSAWWPAWRAAKLTVVEALRHV